MAKFTFPIPGRRHKPQPSPSATRAPLTKAEKILGTSSISVDSHTALRETGARPQRSQWDAASGISISLTDTESLATTVTGRGARGDGADLGPTPWDMESDIIPRQLHPHDNTSRPLRSQKSAATISHDYRDVATEASTLQRRQSNASTILSHYDPMKVPLSISQQTSNSAMAKGIPTKTDVLLDAGGGLSPPADRRKPPKLDLSILRGRNRKDQNAQLHPVLGNSYVTRSPSFISNVSPLVEGWPSPPRVGWSKRSAKLTLPSTQYHPHSASTPELHGKEAQQSELHQLYDRYEQNLFDGHAEEETSPADHEPCLDDFPEPPNPHRSEYYTSEPSPPLTAAPTLATFVTPLSNPKGRTYQPPSRGRKDSTGSRFTTKTSTSANALPSHLMQAKEYASSISSRNTGASRTSRGERSTFDADLQGKSVLSLSDSESEDETFSESAPKSSISSHGNASVDGRSVASESRMAPMSRPPPPTSIFQDRSATTSKQSNYAPLNDYLVIPGLGSQSNANRLSSETFLTPSVYSSRDSRQSVQTSSTLDSISRAKPTAPTHGYSGTDPTPSTAFPTPSSAGTATTVPEPAPPGFGRSMSAHRNSDQPTPPLSPSSVDLDFYLRSPEAARKEEATRREEDARRESTTSVTGGTLDGRLMAVTRQEEMLLAALRKKRAMMRENILAEIEGEKSNVANSETNSTAARNGTQKVTTLAAQLDELDSAEKYPKRKSSLWTDMDLIERSTTSQSHVRANGGLKTSAPHTAQRPVSASLEDKRFEQDAASRVDGPVAPGKRREKVLMYLDRPLGGLDDVDVAEPSPDLSEFYGEFYGDSEGEGDSRRSRIRSKFYSNAPRSYQTHTRKGSERPRADSNPLSPRFHVLPAKLDEVPELDVELDYDMDNDIHFDGFSDIMEPLRIDKSQDLEVARPDSPPAGMLLRGHIKGKNSTVRISAVGPVWGDDD